MCGTQHDFSVRCLFYSCSFHFGVATAGKDEWNWEKEIKKRDLGQTPPKKGGAKGTWLGLKKT